LAPNAQLIISCYVCVVPSLTVGVGGVVHAGGAPRTVVEERGVPVTKPLYQAKAEFFKTLGHPARIRILELLAEREQAVSELLPEVGIEAAHLSQQLAVLRRMNLVTSRRDGATVFYALVSPQVGELLRVARTILAEVITNQAELLDDLRTAG
jgi:ArsR family transcriptional regulator